MKQPDARVPVSIRPLTPRDWRGLPPLMQAGVTLNAPDSVVDRFAPLPALLHAPALLSRRGTTRTYVARCSGTPCALLQARDHAWPAKWDIIYLGAAEPVRGAGSRGRADLWTALLEYTTAAAGRRGVPRLYAKLPSGAEEAAEEALHAAGYVPYGLETLYELRGGTSLAGCPPDGSRAASVRSQTAEDTWAVHQLYILTEPKPTQYAEAYTSDRWELPRRRFGRKRPNVYGLVIDYGPELVGYCRVTRSGKRSRLDLLVQPRAREELGQAIDEVLRWLRPAPDEQIYCPLREHQRELHTILTERGFRPRSTHSLLIRYTVVSIRATTGVRNPIRERGRAAVLAHP